MTNLILRIAAAVLCLAIAPAHATFHLWRMTEIYSSADGTVQFLELGDCCAGENLLSGHVLRATGPFGTHTFEFTTDLPNGQTSGKRFLVGTQSFAALNIVAPDYVVPDNFFSTSGGSVNFANVDTWNYGPLPTDTRSLSRDGSMETNSPKNFAGASGTVPQLVSFQALWYKSPAESERGWGVNVTHQGNILFATWFTYDLDGSQMWLVGPAVERTGSGHTITGTLYSTTRPPFKSVPFNPNAVGVTPVGTITFAFSSADAGTMTTTVNGATVVKPITKQVFSTVSTCTPGGTPGATANFQDLWYAAPAESERGWGVNLTHQGDILFATWFTYDATGKGMWIVGPDVRRTTGNTFTGALYRTTGPAFNANPWDPNTVGVQMVGSATFAFTDLNNGTFSYTVNGISQAKPITRQVYSAPATVCR
jgi:hypothetical protein